MDQNDKMISYKTIKNDRQWRATTGLTEVKFHRLCRAFRDSYESVNEVSLAEGAARLDVSLILPTYEDCLFLVLFQLKNGLGYDNLGFLIGTDGNTAQLNFEKYHHILEKALGSLGAMPKRGFTSVAEFESYLEGEKDLILDGSEQATQRPKGYEKQKEKYSGKKKHIPIKN